MRSSSVQKPIMVFGTSSGAGKSLTTIAICRMLLNLGDTPLPFKGQNMSNNAWVDEDGGEMAYSQAVQAWAAGQTPICAMNPVLLKPKGNCTSEVIHLGESVGIAKAETYYDEWFRPGWLAIRKGLTKLKSTEQTGRLVIEGAGSPVEINLQYRDLTNLRIAQFLRANCLLVADIERGGVFAQIVGTLSLLRPIEKSLIKGILINRFRGRKELFEEGKKWLENQTGIPVIGVMPWLNDFFPPEDSLDLIEIGRRKSSSEIEIAVIKLPSISNFSDLDPLKNEPSVDLHLIEPGSILGNPDALIIPGSKQTIKDLQVLHESGLANQIKSFANNGGIVLGICGGMQMLGHELHDPLKLENSPKGVESGKHIGLELLPIKTVFEKNKSLQQRHIRASWPACTLVKGFELHHGESRLISEINHGTDTITEDPSLGWVKTSKYYSSIAGTYLHGILDNGTWRRLWLNQIRKQKGIEELPHKTKDHSEQRDGLINKLADIFAEEVNIEPLLEK
ncbi:cobyric acid synthase [Prochlorococcus sp. MIT 1300]|uniref:cobyric acid synthase n=1 Tax=Prochlorococcus sp. MIT 1300 TaxID=3096218 RepID=UPI002A751CD1|nr:cobyric acid synthase [Prochlorococcus sp. MIT 1300]